jgi:ABC-type transporter Mla subunit MlaD
MELMGGKKMEIDPGTSGTFDVMHDTIPGISGGDLASLVTFINSLTPTVTNLATKIDSVLNSVNDLFGNGQLKQKAYATLDNTSAAITELRGVLRENRARIANTLTQIETLATTGNATLNEIRPKINGALDSVTDFLHHSQFTLAQADTLLASFNTILVESRNNKSLFYKLTSDKAFSLHVDSMILGVNALLRQMRSQGLDVNIKVF